MLSILADWALRAGLDRLVREVRPDVLRSRYALQLGLAATVVGALGLVVWSYLDAGKRSGLETFSLEKVGLLVSYDGNESKVVADTLVNGLRLELDSSTIDVAIQDVQLTQLPKISDLELLLRDTRGTAALVVRQLYGKRWSVWIYTRLDSSFEVHKVPIGAVGIDVDGALDSTSTLNKIRPVALYLAGYANYKLADYPSAARFFRRALRAVAVSPGRISSEVIQLRLGESLIEVGEHKEAEKYLRQAAKSGGPWCRRAANAYAHLLLEQQRVHEAQAVVQPALEYYTTYRLRDSIWADLTHHLANCYLFSGKAEKAIPLYHEVIEYDRETDDVENFTALYTRSNLATAKMAVGRIWDGCSDYEKMLQEWRDGRIERLHDAGAILHQTGYCRSLLGKPDEAEQLFEEALAIKLETVGEADPSTAKTLHQLGCLARQRGDREQARRLFAEDLRISRASLGDKHPETVVAREALASVIASGAVSGK